MDLQPEYIGQLLLERSFEDWFRYMFRVIEGREFIVEPIHKDLFDTFQRVYNLETIRQTINLPPRSSKTTLCKYFIVRSWTINPKCNFIYTSYSQSLLNDIARDVQNILEHPVYKAMYPIRTKTENEELAPIDEFWRQYLVKTENKNTYSSKKITTHAGGICLFSSIGGQITGFGCGIRGAKKFSGCLIQDDFNKTSDILSEVMREKAKKYFTETLLSRLNDFNVPILNVQQRLHLDDISGFLQRNYNFDVLIKPLIDINGVCQIPSQYDEKRLKEIMFDKSTFAAQYQQDPMAEVGNIIKREWWKYYNPDVRNEDGALKYPVEGTLIITADTAYKKTKSADYSCFQCWELRRNAMLMRDMVVGKWDFPELLEKAKLIWDKWTSPDRLIRAKYFFIEDKASGTSLEQTLISLGIEATGWKPKDYDYPEDKVSRMKEASWSVFNGLVFLPVNSTMSEYLVNEAALFSEDDSHNHDDSCDSFTEAHSIWRYYGGGVDNNE